MKWEGEEQSENLEDRRSMGPQRLAIGGIAALLVVAAGYFLGVDPSLLNQFLGNPERRPKSAGPKSPTHGRGETKQGVRGHHSALHGGGLGRAIQQSRQAVHPAPHGPFLRPR